MDDISMERLHALATLHEGDKVLLINGDTAIFIRMKKKNFLATMKGADYDIPISWYVETVNKVDYVQIKKDEDQAKVNILSNLRKDDYFYIVKGDHAELFKFISLTKGKIIARNPVNDRVTNIDLSFKIGIPKNE